MKTFEAIPHELRLNKLRKVVYTVGCALRDDVLEEPVEWRPMFITLTYTNTDDWRAQHIRDYLKRLRVFLYRKGLPCRYVWCAELQKRGALHYHIILFLPVHVWLPSSDRRGWWPFGSSNTQQARKGVGYLMKYASKMGSKEQNGHAFPKGARLYGYGGLSDEGKRRVRFYRASKAARAQLGASPEDPTRPWAEVDMVKVTGGWCDRITGEMVRSDWLLSVRLEHAILFRKRDMTTAEIKSAMQAFLLKYGDKKT